MSARPSPAARALAAVLLVCALAACDRGAPAGQEIATDAAPLVAFDTGTVLIATGADTVRVRAEIAETTDQRAYGLMERASLPAGAGMIFLYPEAQDSSSGFWMYRTRVPLDIAFLDDRGRIVRILTMEPCASPDPRWCPTYAPGVPYTAALEVNRGFFAARGIEPGDRVVLRREGASGPAPRAGAPPA